MTNETIVWYRKTEEEARKLAAENPDYVFLGYGYNKSFPTYWAVMVKGNRNDRAITA